MHQLYFIARREGRTVAFLNVTPVFPDGWLIENTFRAPMCPNGTSELLMDAVMRAAPAFGIATITLGLVPLCGKDGPLFKLLRKALQPFYDFDGLSSHRAQLKPDEWKPLYLIVPKEQRQIAALMDLVRALLPEGFIPLLVQRATRSSTSYFNGATSEKNLLTSSFQSKASTFK